MRDKHCKAVLQSICKVGLFPRRGKQSSSSFLTVAGGQLTACLPPMLHTGKIQLLHRNPAVRKPLGWWWCATKTSREFTVNPNYGACWEPEVCPPTTMTTRTSTCPRALLYPHCWRNWVSVVGFSYMKTLLCNQQSLKGWYSFSDILLYVVILVRFSYLALDDEQLPS